MGITDLEIIITSCSLGERDGIGIEVWFQDTLLIEIFRDELKASNIVTTYDDIPLEIVEYSIKKFKLEILDDKG